MLAIVINPWLKSASAVEVKDSAEDLLVKLSWLGSEVEGVQIGTVFPNGDNLICSEMVSDGTPGFLLGSLYCRGMGLILGSKDGQWMDAQFTQVEIQDWVRFPVKVT